MSTDNNKNWIQQTAEKIMPGLETDHGGVNAGDIVVLIISSVLFLYTGYRSWHFLSLSIPSDFQILALVGLWGIDVAMIGWAIVWIFGSTSPGQDGVSMSMWVIDVIAMVLTSTIDTLMYSDSGGIPPIFKTLAWYGVPIIIVGNAVMAIVYHYTSPKTKQRRKKRKLQSKIDDARLKGQFEIEEINETAKTLKEYTLERTSALLSIATIAEQSQQITALEQDIQKRLNAAGLNHLSGSLGLKNSDQEQDSESIQNKIEKLRLTLKNPEMEKTPGYNGSHPKG